VLPPYVTVPYTSTLEHLYTLAVKNKLKSLGTDYLQLQLDVDVLRLLTLIRNIALANADIQKIRNIALANADIQNPYCGAAQAFK
jgi:hypothetical protein